METPNHIHEAQHDTKDQLKALQGGEGVQHVLALLAELKMTYQEFLEWEKTQTEPQFTKDRETPQGNIRVWLNDETLGIRGKLG